MSKGKKTKKNPTPEVGQVWADNDERTADAGEFEIVEIDGQFARVRRSGGRRTRISLERLTDTSSRGYRYIGKSR